MRKLLRSSTLRLLLGTFFMLLTSGPLHALRMAPELFTFKTSRAEVRYLLFDWDEKFHFFLDLPSNWKYQVSGGGIKLIPDKDFAEVEFISVPRAGLPEGLKSEQDLAFYRKFVESKLVGGAEIAGQVKRAGPFASEGESDSFGYVFTLNGLKFATAWGFINLPDKDFQLRYKLTAAVEDFEALHTQTRELIGQLNRITKEDVNTMRSQDIVFD